MASPTLERCASDLIQHFERSLCLTFIYLRWTKFAPRPSVWCNFQLRFNLPALKSEMRLSTSIFFTNLPGKAKPNLEFEKVPITESWAFKEKLSAKTGKDLRITEALFLVQILYRVGHGPLRRV